MLPGRAGRRRARAGRALGAAAPGAGGRSAPRAGRRRARCGRRRAATTSSIRGRGRSWPSSTSTARAICRRRGRSSPTPSIWRAARRRAARARRLRLPAGSPRAPSRSSGSRPRDDVNGAPADLAKGCRQAQLVGGALVGSIVVDAVIVELIRATRAPFSAASPPTCPSTRYGWCSSCWPLPISSPSGSCRAQMLGVGGSGGPRPPINVVRTGPGRLFTVSVVVLALCLAVAIYGARPVPDRRASGWTSTPSPSCRCWRWPCTSPGSAQWEEWAKDMARRA